MSTRTAARLALAIGMTSLVLIVLGLSLVLLFYRSFPRLEAYYNWREIVLLAPILVTIGTLVAARRPDHPIGWLFASAGLAGSIQLVAGQYAVTSLAAAPGTLPGGAIAAWVVQPLQMAFVVMLVFLLLLFPTGRLLSRRWQLVAWSFAAGMVLSLVDLGFSPGPLEDFPIENPFGIAGMAQALDVIGGIGLVLGVFGGIFGAVVSLLVRLRRARGLERQQIKWFAYAAVLGVAGLVGANIFFPEQMEGFMGSLLWTAAPAGLSVAVAIAILRYRLYDIDLIIRRTLVYGALTGALALVYLGSVVLLQSLVTALGGQQSAVAIVVSTLVIAALFNPLRRRIQAVIDRRFYRRKYDAAQVLAAFAATARDETDLDDLTERLLDAVSETMQPAHISLWLQTTGRAYPPPLQRGDHDRPA